MVFAFFSNLGKLILLRLHHYLVALLIFLAGVSLSLATFYFYRQQDMSRTRIEFDHIADLRIFLIEDTLLDTVNKINYIKQFFYASHQISKNDFHIFVTNPFKTYPNLLVLGWIQGAIFPSNSSYTTKLNFIALEDFSLNHSAFVPFTYLEFAYAEPLYFDYTNYQKFVTLLKSSQQTVGITISESMNFLGKKKQKGFFLFAPVFLEEVKNKKEKRLFGTIVGFSNFEDIIQHMRARVKPMGININIYDVTTVERLLYSSHATVLVDPPNLSYKELQNQQKWTRQQTFEFGNRLWKITATPTLDLIQTYQTKNWSHIEIPIIGILLSGLSTFYFLSLVNRRIMIEQEVEARTNELESTNTILQQEIHERQRIEEEFVQKQYYLQKRHEALEYLTKFTTSELRNAINEVILRTATVMEIDRVSVWFYEDLGQMQILSCTGLYSLSTNSFSNHLELSSTFFPHYFNFLKKHSYLILPSPNYSEVNQELASYLAVFNIISKLDIPIVFEGKLLGVLCCEETRGHREWILEDRHFGQTIADIMAIMAEQSARRKVERALQESEEQLRFITQKAIDGIISLNNYIEIISWNYGAEQIFGYSEVEMLGKSIQLVILEHEFIEQKSNIKSIELKGKHKKGTIFPIEVSHSHWEKGGSWFDTIIVRDITERKENEKRLLRAIRETKAANEAKNEFLAKVSHELRTPLNAIIGFNQCLLMNMDGTINDQQYISLKKIEKSSFHLLSLINNILDLAKIEAHRMELEISSHNIVEIVISCVEEIQSLASQKNLDIHVSLNKPFILVEIDKMRIRQVLLNLLSNAVKFTEKGNITVSLLIHPSSIEIRVIDTGIGLSPEEISKLFQPFSQADTSITRKYGGTGLGLAISKQIIDLHGGEINVESEKGKGSKFSIILPKNYSFDRLNTISEK